MKKQTIKTRIFPIRYVKRPPLLKDVAIVFPISDEIAGMLQLYAVAHQKTLSQVNRELCIRFIKDDTCTSSVHLTAMLAGNAQKHWNNLQADIMPNMMRNQYAAFIERVRYELTYRGLKTQYINEIIKQIHI